jgi:eukaryotic-like serine/threonine-protein kinase
MGQVWHGYHVRQRMPVAVKVIAEERARNKRFHAAFADEVRAVARLDHPSIVTVYEHGVIPIQVEAESEGQLVAGTPYLVMEYCNGQSLRGIRNVESYDELRRTLLQLLDALAHAHARGVIHRDIKPGNVMLHVSDDGDYAIKLTDFGIARAADDQPDKAPAGSSGTGTPGYMAPEQIVADLVSQGPWTDLYAVGCLAFRLAAGHVPYATAADDNAMLAAHLREPVPLLESYFPLPNGMQGWIEKLLAKTPTRRFVRAADAIWALLQLGEPNTSDSVPARDTLVDPIEARSETVTTLALIDVSELDDADWGMAEPKHDAPTCPIPGAGDAPPIPLNYERATPRTAGLLGVGLGLYGLRPVPLVGREDELDVIWARLRNVATSAHPGMVTLVGPTGQGKSRLAEWVTERAHELGSAIVMRAHHAPVPGPLHGLGAMLARHYRCIGLERDEVLNYLRGHFGDKPPFDHLTLSLTELMAPRDTDGPSYDGNLRFSNMEERYAAIGMLFEHLSLTRPILLWLDDVQWGADALGLAEYLMSRNDLRVMVLATLRDDLGDARPLEQARMRRLLEFDRVEALPIGPLSPTNHRSLVRQLLGLEGALSRQVQDKTAGNPLFAVQLVGEWVRRGVLEGSDEGFRLRGGERAELPDSLERLWLTRIDQAVGTTSRPDDTRSAVEVAAALGEHVQTDEWHRVCAALNLSPDPNLVGRLRESGLARLDEYGWSFVHGMLRDTVGRRSTSEGRGQRQHEACAEVLRQRHGPALEQAERLGHHLFMAGQHAESLVELDRAIRYRFDRGDFDRVRQILRERSQVLDAVRARSTDPRRVEDRLWSVRVELARGDFDAAGKELWEAEVTAHEPWQLARVVQLHAEVRWAQGKMKEAEQLAEGARQQFEAIGDRGGAADCQRITAKCLLEGRADYPRALRCTQRARKAYVDLADADRLAECDYLEAKILTELNDYDAALASCRSALQHHRLQGHRLGLAKCANQMGEIARMRGTLEDAERHYMRSLALLEAMGSESARGPRLNLALVWIHRGQLDKALGELRHLQRELSATEARALGYVDYALLPCLAFEREWLAFDEQLDRARQWVPETGRVDKDYASLAEKAAGLAEMQGERARAIAVLELAATHWQALGKIDRADLSRRRITAIEGGGSDG